tara:strand:+ start:763 stop:984 length:222 start_codon:yes stop_codon:yes gene_type:complete
MSNWDSCDPFMGGCRDIHKPLPGEPSLVPLEYWATPKKNMLTEEERERFHNELEEEELLNQWQSYDDSQEEDY